MEFVETNEPLKQPNFYNTGAIFFNFTVTTAAGDESPASFSTSLTHTHTHTCTHTRVKAFGFSSQLSVSSEVIA